MSKLSYLAAAAVALLCASCATPQKIYTDFYANQQYKSVSVNADASALQDGKGRVENLLSDQSHKLMNQVHNSAKLQLREKGYAPQSGYQSIGLTLPDTTQVFVSNNPSQYEGDLLSTPYYVKKNGATPTKVRQLTADRLFSRVFSHDTKSKKLKDVDYPEIKNLGLPQNQYILLIHGFSRNVNTGKQLGQAAIVAVATMGTFVMWEPDISFVQVAIIDPQTSKVVWANDGKIGKSVEQDVAKIFQPLPVFGTKE
ncbi:hypothetical protein [Rubritalea squalenifaciens]|nr:hypothetical protein [Rubritalea squalenifaciens]